MELSEDNLRMPKPYLTMEAPHGDGTVTRGFDACNIAAVLKATESKIVPKRVGRYTRFKVVLSFIVLKKSFIIYYIERKNTLY